jgi:tetratricopeptide (TPR) repeat protein
VLKILTYAPLLAILLGAAQGEAPRSHFESASRALASGDLTAAEQGFQAVLKVQPKNIGALGNLGVVYSRMGKTADAIAVYRRALKLAPDDPLLNLNLGLAYLKQENYAAAKDLFQATLEAQPANAQARELLASTQLFTGEVDKAVPVLETSQKHSGTLYFLSIAYLKQGRREEARKIIDQLFGMLAPAQANFLVGRAYYESTLFDDAVAALEKARDADPELPGIWRELGKTYVSLRRSEEARKALMEAVRRTPADDEASYFLGALLVNENLPSEALPYLEKSRTARPDFWGSYYYLGKAALAGGKAPKAVVLLERAAALDPKQSSVWYVLARALKAAGRSAEATEATKRFRTLSADESATAGDELPPGSPGDR